jgi:hypothetical protein
MRGATHDRALDRVRARSSMIRASAPDTSEQIERRCCTGLPGCLSACRGRTSSSCR